MTDITTVRQLLPTDKFISHDISEDIITVNGIRRIETLLKEVEYRDDEDRLHEGLPPLPVDWDWSWMVRKGQYRGKIANRIETFYKKEHGIKLPDSVKSVIGARLSDNRLTKGTYHFDFTSTFDWRAGDFGDSGSCFWGSRERDRWALEAYGAMAVRFYSDDTFDRGVGRAWLILDDEAVGDMSIIMFNGYGDSFFGNSLQEISGIISHFLGMQMRNIRIRNNGEEQASIYFNGAGNATLIAPAGVMKQYQYSKRGTARNPLPTVDFRIPVEIRGRCAHTGTYIMYGQFYHSCNGNLYCQEAYDELFGECAITGVAVLLTDLRELPDGRLVHVDEYNKLLSPCQCCKERYMRDELTWLEGSSVLICPTCQEEHTVVDAYSGNLCLVDTTCVVNYAGDRIDLTSGYQNSLMLDDNLAQWVADIDLADVLWLEDCRVISNIEELRQASIEDLRLALCDGLVGKAYTYADLAKHSTQEIAYGMVGFVNITAKVEGIL